MFLDQNMCIGEFGVLRVCKLCIRLSRVMDIVELRMYIVMDVYIDNDR